jgi:hypothetical protein
MSPQNIRIIFTIAGAIWVGGWGLLMFRYPEFFARFNARFGFGRFASPKYIAFLRWLGITEMILAVVSVISLIVMSFLGLKWY